MKAFSIFAGIAVLAVGLAGCSSSAAPAPAPTQKAPEVKAPGSFYAEESYKGRYYVFGTEKAHKTFQDSQMVPTITKVFIGAGPEGQTLVLEADPKANDLQNRLKSDYETRHSTKLP
jgi:hypothetical protein